MRPPVLKEVAHTFVVYWPASSFFSLNFLNFFRKNTVSLLLGRKRPHFSSWGGLWLVSVTPVPRDGPASVFPGRFQGRLGLGLLLSQEDRVLEMGQRPTPRPNSRQPLWTWLYSRHGRVLKSPVLARIPLSQYWESPTLNTWSPSISHRMSHLPASPRGDT